MNLTIISIHRSTGYHTVWDLNVIKGGGTINQIMTKGRLLC